MRYLTGPIIYVVGGIITAAIIWDDPNISDYNKPLAALVGGVIWPITVGITSALWVVRGVKSVSTAHLCIEK